MSKQEICYVKQSVCCINDWDVYQIILRQVFKMFIHDADTKGNVAQLG